MSAKFDESVWQLLRRIPKGKVTTYKQIAIALVKPNSARAVGNACNRNPNLETSNCFKIIKSDGSVGGYKAGRVKKIKKLEKDGIIVKRGKVELKKYLYYFK